MRSDIDEILVGKLLPDGQVSQLICCSVRRGEIEYLADVKKYGLFCCDCDKRSELVCLLLLAGF